jgi:hypothetical protein
VRLASDLHEPLPILEQLNSSGELFREDAPHDTIARVSAGDPDQRRWRSQFVQQPDEVAVLAHDHSAFGASGEEDLAVACLLHAKGAERTGLSSHLRPDRGAKLGFQPNAAALW